MNPNPSGIAQAYAALATVQIPNHWSSEQALAVWELLQELADRVWARYNVQLTELLREDRQADPAQPDLFDPDDPIPF